MKRAALAIITVTACLLSLAGSAAGASTKRPESYTLSSSKSRVYGTWGFSLVSKTYWYVAVDTNELKQQLSKLPPGTRIGWYTRPEIGFVYPPEPMFSDIRRFIAQHHFQLVFMRAPRTKPKA